MIHNLQVMLQSLFGGLSSHLAEWDGWAVLIAAALFGLRRAPLWIPLVVAVIINPMPFAIVSNLIHGRQVGVEPAALFTLVQIVLAYCGYLLGRVVARFR